MRRLLPFAAAVLSTVVCLHGAASNLVLKLAWAKQFRNQLSIDATVTVLDVGAKEKDGDRHAGSRDNAVGLPMVAEILNGSLSPEKNGVQALVPGTQPDKQVYGAWRLWVEHPPSGGTQCQSFTGPATPPICAGESPASGVPSNPPHSFEIHPVFVVDGVDVAKASMVLTAENQEVKTAEDACAEYSGPNKNLQVTRSTSALILTSIAVKDNYARAHFTITKTRTATTRQLDGKVDGGYVVANWDVTGCSSDVRVFYYLNSEPGQLLDAATVGKEVDLLVMPRINLDAVLSKTETSASAYMQLPYEFVAMAVVH